MLGDITRESVLTEKGLEEEELRGKGSFVSASSTVVSPDTRGGGCTGKGKLAIVVNLPRTF